MRGLTGWLRRQAAREAKRPRLDDALLTDRAPAYARYRLRFLGWRMILRAALHMLEVTMFASVFSIDVLGPVLVVRSLAAITLGVWWGGLERMRGQVRDLASERAWHGVRRTIDAWLSVAVIAAVLIVGGVSGWFITHPDPYLGFSVYDAFIIACVIRLGLDLVTRTYHSGLFALRRIYRPLWSLLAGDLLDVLLIVALWPFLLLWCFGPAIILAGIVRTVLTVYFVRRSYGSSSIPGLTWRLLPRSLGSLNLADLSGFVRHGLANSVFQIDTVLILTLVYASMRSPGYLPLAVLFYVLRPFVTAGYSWTRLFYFDFKRLALGHSQFFRARFERFLKRVAIVFACITAALAVGWTAAFWKGPGIGWDLAGLVPFFVARSVFGLYQMQAFSYERYRYLFVSGAVVGLGVLGVGFVPLSRLVIFLALAALMVLVVVLGGAPRSAGLRDDRRSRGVVPLPRWLALLARTAGPTRVGAARVNTRSGGVARVLGELAGELGEGVAARFGRNLILWFESAEGEGQLTRARALVVTAGCLSQLEIASHQEGGTGALAQLASGQILGQRLSPVLSGESGGVATGDQLRREFSRLHPRGEVIEVRGGRIAAADGELAPFEVRRVMIDVLRAAGGRTVKPRRADKVDVSVYAPRGEPEILFVLPREEDAQLRAAWRKRVQDATLAGSLV